MHLDKSVLLRYYIKHKSYAAVVESADTRDLKSLDSNIVPVQVRSAAPKKNLHKSVGSFYIKELHEYEHIFNIEAG